jgi:hypothetical protein
MAFAIRMGQPEMEALWQDLSMRKQAGRLGREEEKFFKKLVKVLGYLSADPRHNSLASHEISDLSRKHGIKIFQSYLENNTPGAGRIFWAYGPDKGDITVLAVEPHPEDKKRGAYERLKLSAVPLPRSKPRRHLDASCPSATTCGSGSCLTSAGDWLSQARKTTAR